MGLPTAFCCKQLMLFLEFSITHTALRLAVFLPMVPTAEKPYASVKIVKKLLNVFSGKKEVNDQQGSNSFFLQRNPLFRMGQFFFELNISPPPPKKKTVPVPTQDDFPKEFL